MPKVRFCVSIERTDGFSSKGIDDVVFLLSANVGEPLKQLSKIASGGELSRIMLALKSVLREKESTGTVIFDEKGFRAFAKGYKAIELPEVPQLGGHYPEIKYFAEIIENNGINTINPPESSMDTIRMALAEMKSADLGGQIVELASL